MSSLDGLRVWITRPQPEADASARRWSSRGASVVVLPLLEIRALALDESIREDVAKLAADVVVISSPNVAEHFVREFGVLAGGGRPWPTACVGQKTARRAADLGLDVVVVADRATGEDLARTILGRGSRPTCLIPGGTRQRPQLADALRAGGCEVRSVTLYETAIVSPDLVRVQQILEAGLDLAACYSPSAVDALAATVSMGAVAVAALGETTAARVRGHDLRLVACPDDPGESALLESVARWWERRDGAS